MDYSDFSDGKIWAIRAAHLESMMADLPDMKTANEMAIRFTAKPETLDDFMLREGVAIIPVSGPISKRSSFLSYLFGGSSISSLSKIYMAALEDRDVQAIVLQIDSPGGTIAGLSGFGDFIFESRDIKPVVAFGDGMVASAAYWIASSTSKIIVEQAADVGSIGVAMVHVDHSEMDKQEGIKRTILAAGKYKALGNSAEPLSKDAKKVFQERLDYKYTLFVNTVARNLGLDAETVLNDMADGRVFIGQQAVDIGLAHQVGSLDTAIETALSMTESAGTQFNYFKLQEGKMDIKTIQELKAAFPELVAQIEEAAKGTVDTGEAVKAETDRILGLVNIQLGQEKGAAFKELVETGVTVDQFAAIRKNQPEAPQKDDTNAQMLEAIHNAGAEDAGQVAAATGAGKDFMTQMDEYVALQKCTKTVAMQAVMKKDPAAHKAYLESVN